MLCLLLVNAPHRLWERDSPLLQLPHVTADMVTKCKAAGIENVYDLMEMEVRFPFFVWCHFFFFFRNPYIP
jgi:hypothetical protein